jgi:excisionase family DNA binding protein
MTIDLSTWLTKQEAADRLGVSTKAIERWTRAGKLEQRFRPQAGSPHVAVYFPDDVAKLAQERQPGLAPFVLPVGTALPASGNGHPPSTALDRVPAAGDQVLGPGDDLLRVLVTAARRVLSETSQTPALFLTLREASAVTGLTQAYLRRACESGTLTAIRDRGWRIRRTDLEGL